MLFLGFYEKHFLFLMKGCEEELGEKQIAAKALIVDELAEKIQSAQSVILYDYIGLNVAEVSELRNRFRAVGVEYRVIKNTYILRAANKLGIEGLEPHLHGTTALAFGFNDPVAPAKVLTEFIKSVKKTDIKVGLLDGKVLDKAEVTALANLPSREELIAKILGSMNAPITGAVMVLSGVIRAFVVALNAIKEKKETL